MSLRGGYIYIYKYEYFLDVVEELKWNGSESYSGTSGEMRRREKAPDVVINSENGPSRNENKNVMRQNKEIRKNEKKKNS